MGVPTFGASPRQDDTAAGALAQERAEWEQLDPLEDFAPRLAGEVTAGLTRLGYACDTVSDPGVLTAADLGDRVTSTIRGSSADDVVVVHVISHGEADPDTGSLYVVGSDGAVDESTDVEAWLKSVHGAKFRDRRPSTLFLLDLCHSGMAARFPWQFADENTKAWVIAACSPDRSAFDGRFSEAVAGVLEDIQHRRLDIHPSVEHVRLDTVVQRVNGRLARLSSGKSRQVVTSNALDLRVEAGDWRFFPNPAHAAQGQVSRVRAHVEHALVPFLDDLDDGLDAAHFAAAATGAGPLRSQVRVGLFTGRTAQLDALSRWLDGDDDAGLRVVTGEPGAGKSALLGILVCAAHPKLRESTQTYWAHLDEHTPGRCPALAAVHARQRSLDEVTASIARQLGLTAPETAHGWAPAELVKAISTTAAPPVVVVDALDEAKDPGSVLTVLLLPLAGARRPDGAPACRLLVGSRTGTRWPTLNPLVAAVARPEHLLNLSTINPTTLETDLRTYTSRVLRTHADHLPRPVLDRVATAVAGALTTRRHTDATNPPASTEAADEPGWGEFLVAGLFLQHLISSLDPADPEPERQHKLDATLQRIPTTLPGVLDLDLTTREVHAPLARPLLTALAHARGEGAPLDVLRLLTPAFHTDPQHEPLDADTVFEALALERFYLRAVVDANGTTLYRLYHQGLADHLRTQARTALAPTNPEALIVETLLADLPRHDGHHRWDVAEPYQLRHAIEHATAAGTVDELLEDPSFLVHAAPATLERALSLAFSEPARLAAAVYRTSAGRHRDLSPEGRAQVLAIDAARYGAGDLARRLTAAATQPRWVPQWATGSQVNPNLRQTLIGHHGTVAAVACTTLNGRAVAVTGSWDGTVRVWDLTTGEQIGEPLTGHQDTVAAVACTTLDGRPVAVTAGSGGMVRVWDLIAREQVGDPLTGHQDTVAAVACTTLDGRPVAVTAGGDDTVRVWDLIAREQVGDPLTGHQDTVAALACTTLDRRPVALTAGRDATVRIWDLTAREQVGDPLTGHQDTVAALACTTLDGSPVAVTGGWDRTVRVWDLTTREQVGQPLAGHHDPVAAVACTTLEDRPVAVTASGDETARIWDLTAREQVGKPLTGHQDAVAAVACATVDDRAVAVTGSWDHTVRVWDLTTREQVGDPLTGHQGTMAAVACATVDDRAVAVTGSWDHTVRVWDLTTGKQIGDPLTGRRVGSRMAGGHQGTVAAVACTALRGRPVAVTAGGDATVWVWDLTTRELVGDLTGRWVHGPFAGQQETVAAVACTTLEGHPVAVTGSELGTVRVWDLATGRQVIGPLTGHQGIVATVACTTVGGCAVAVTGSEDGMVRVWDLTTGQQIGDSLTGHQGTVATMACTTVDGRAVAVTGGWDGTVRVWDLTTCRQIGDPLTGHQRAVNAVACTSLDRHPVAISAGGDGRLRVWDLLTGRPLLVYDLPTASHALATGAGHLVVGIGWDLVTFALGTDGNFR